MKKLIGNWIEKRNVAGLRYRIGRLVFTLYGAFGRNVLDAGCGEHGSWDYRDTEEIQRADKMLGDDFEQPLVYPDEAFSMVVCAGVIQYLSNYEDFVTELNRILKPGGILILATLNNGCWSRRFGLIDPILKPDERVLFTDRLLELFIYKKGFDVVKKYGIDFMPLPYNLCTNFCWVLRKKDETL